MDTIGSIKEFELGPIRPPSEAQSILLRLTRNCPWNKCAFCPVYKGEKFSFRTVEEVKSDIDAIAHIKEHIEDRIDSMGLNKNDSKNILSAVNGMDPDPGIPESYLRQVAYWMHYGMKSLFLQDADSLVLKTDNIVQILNHIRENFPSLERITTYTRAKTVSNKSLQDLEDLKKAGLNRIHIGMESGSDKVLQLICKGVTQAEQIDAGQKAIAAGFELSEYFMPGVGGTEYIEENALQSAKVINAVNPTFIRLRSIIPVPGTPLYDLFNEKKWTYPSELDKINEIKLFISKLENINSTLKSDHIMNLLEDIEGTFPEDKEIMLNKIDSFLSMDTENRESFIVGRRMGKFRSVSDYSHNPDIEKIKQDIKTEYGSIDEGVLQILWNYI